MTPSRFNVFRKEPVEGGKAGRLLWLTLAVDAVVFVLLLIFVLLPIMLMALWTYKDSPRVSAEMLFHGTLGVLSMLLLVAAFNMLAGLSGLAFADVPALRLIVRNSIFAALWIAAAMAAIVVGADIRQDARRPLPVVGSLEPAGLRLAGPTAVRTGAEPAA